jgi:H+/Cl- antiporter ClcA
MKINPRTIPWLSIGGSFGLGFGYLVGQGGGQNDPMISAYWGLCVGIGLGLTTRLVLTRQWVKKLEKSE